MAHHTNVSCFSHCLPQRELKLSQRVSECQTLSYFVLSIESVKLKAKFIWVLTVNVIVFMISTLSYYFLKRKHVEVKVNRCCNINSCWQPNCQTSDNLMKTSCCCLSDWMDGTCLVWVLCERDTSHWNYFIKTYRCPLCIILYDEFVCELLLIDN